MKFRILIARAALCCVLCSTVGFSAPAIAPTPNIPAAPTNLTSFAGRRGFEFPVFLKWQDNSKSESSFHIERCTGATCTNFKEIGQTGASVNHYIDGLEFVFGKTFRYRVRAHNKSGYSAYTNIRTQKMPL